MQSAPDELAGAVILSVGPDGNPLVVVIPTWSGDPERGRQIVSEIESFGTPVFNQVGLMAAADLLALTDGKLVSGRWYEIATRWLPNLPPDVVSTLIATFEDRTSAFSSIILHHFHGVAARIAPGATAFGMRQPHFTAVINAVWEPAPVDAMVHRRWAENVSSRLSRWALPGGYANLLGDNASEQIPSAFGANAQRLLELKRRFDPGNLFSAIPLPDVL
jgi:Berberine and berberine like